MSQSQFKPETDAVASPDNLVDDSGAWLEDHFPIHKAIFQGDIKKLAKILREDPDINVDAQDTHGNTALHIAAMLGNKDAAKLLLTKDALTCIKNNEGWKSLHEAISVGDRQIIGLFLMAHKRQSHGALSSQLPAIQKHLSGLNDFYMEAKWSFETWIPLLSRIMPSDTFKIFKMGSKLRVDFTLIDFNEKLFRWVRGNMSLLFDPSASKGSQTVLMDNEKEVYQKVRDKNRHLDDELDLLMSSDIIATYMSTRPIEFVRAKNWFMTNKSFKIGEYDADLYHIKGLQLITRKRREHLSKEDVKRNKAMQEAFTDGNLSTMPVSADDEKRRKSLAPPSKPTLTWGQYLRLPDGSLAHLGRVKQEKINIQEVKGMLSVCRDFPLTIYNVVEILQVLEPVMPTIKKFRSFCTSDKMPQGFPIQLEIPVITSLSMKICFPHFHWRNPDESFLPEMFKIPEHYREDPKYFRNM